MFESEFFGHVRGAFTGALRDRPGRFQVADGGTIFLDEIGDLPLELQPKLLRMLQEGQYERVGDDTTREVNVRVIAATNRELPVELKAGRFREDLYYRLNVFAVRVPPLRERKDDIPLLTRHLAALSAQKLRIEEPSISDSQCDGLKAYDWPGNVRELANFIERTMILARDGCLRFDRPLTDLSSHESRSPRRSRAARTGDDFEGRRMAPAGAREHASGDRESGRPNPGSRWCRGSSGPQAFDAAISPSSLRDPNRQEDGAARRAVAALRAGIAGVSWAANSPV